MTSDEAARRLAAVEARTQTLSTMAVGTAIVSVLILLVVSCYVPLARLTDPQESEGDAGETLAAVALTKVLFDEVEQFAADRDRPTEVRERTKVGRIVGQVGLGLAGVGLAAVGIGVLSTFTNRRRRIVLTLAAVGLLAGSLVLALGLGLVTSYDDYDIGPAWGLWVPVLTAVGLLVIHRLVLDLDL